MYTGGAGKRIISRTKKEAGENECPGKNMLFEVAAEPCMAAFIQLTAAAFAYKMKRI